MDPLHAICLELGFFTRAHARDAGYDDRAITREARARRWLRIRRGYYTFPDIWATSTDEERHLCRCRAVLDSLGDAVALSHTSGCIAQEIDVWGLPLDRVHVTRLDGGAGRIEGDVVHHGGLVLDHEVETVNGMRVLAPARCVLEAGSLGSPESALVLLNSSLHRQRCSFDDIGTQFDLMAHWPRLRHLHVPVRMCTHKSESVGETRACGSSGSSTCPPPSFKSRCSRVAGSSVAPTGRGRSTEVSESSTGSSSTDDCSSRTRILGASCSRRSCARTRSGR